MIFLAAVVSRFAFYLLTGYTFDDAYITFRYAENIAAGMGFVYNAGEAVLGTTTPLFTLILSALAVVGISIAVAAVTVSLIASGLTAVVVHRFAGLLGFGRLAVVPVIVCVLFPRLLPTDTGGMETALFTLLVTSAFYFRQTSCHVWSIASASFATLTRPEGLLVLSLLLIDLAVRERRRLWPALAVAGLVIVPWVAFATLYFGSPVPHSMLAKMALYSHFWARPLAEKFVFIMGWHSPFGWLLAAAAVFGSARLFRREGPSPLLEVGWIVITIIALTFSSTLIFRWYMAPVYPIYILLACAALLVAQAKWNRLSQTIRMASLVGLTIVLVAVNYRTVSHYRLEWAELHSIHQGIVDYLDEHANPDDVLATEDIGYVGYHSRLRILDRAGLVSPATVPFNRAGDFYGLIASEKPRWLVISPSDPTAEVLINSDFTESYQQVASFDPPQPSSWTFNLYQRRP